jgi:hypothetical protein
MGYFTEKISFDDWTQMSNIDGIYRIRLIFIRIFIVSFNKKSYEKNCFYTFMTSRGWEKYTLGKNKTILQRLYRREYQYNNEDSYS